MMRIEWGNDNDSYGLGILWDTKLKGKNVHHAFSQHMLLFMFISLKLAIYWG